ncbi:hypothetical protein PRZ48_002443 [Zasmidium cellare]|uniref:DUF7730 domain-containing protein n=1 Tax=Zasmidium cellare TaxID=395010 RepID=A0ABR0F426_ZASCE|nr:hypothetical protein PRZ48_002443 [Zasmidium cellare]
MVLRFHPSGFIIHSDGAELRQHPEDEDTYFEDDSDEFSRKCDVVDTNLTALLQVCKQVYAEAAPILYGQNKFRFTDSSLLRFDGMIKARQPSMARHLRYLELSFRPRRHGYRTFELTIQNLASVKTLKSLAIEIYDYDWLKMRTEERLSAYGRKTKFTKFEQVPGFYDLARVAAKAETFELKGDDEDHVSIKAFLDAEIEKIRAGKGKKVAKKRGVRPAGKQKTG